MTAARIDRILDALRDVWRRDPGLRFGQLLAAVAYQDGRVDSVEEDEGLEARIRAQAGILASRAALGADQGRALTSGLGGEAASGGRPKMHHGGGALGRSAVGAGRTVGGR